MMGGRVTYWDDDKVQSLNPSIILPHERISVVVRSDKSSLNEAITASLNHSSPWWSQVPGFMEEAVGKAPKWPLGNYTDQNDIYYATKEGQESMVVDALRKPFSFSYVDLTQVRRFSEVIGSAHIISSFNGKPVPPTPEAVSSSIVGALEDVENDPKLEVQALNVQRDGAYPIVRVTYWYIKKAAAANGDCYRTWLLREFLLFSYSDLAVEIADRNGWIVPPASVIDIITSKLAEMKCIDLDIGQQIFVKDYQPPRYRQCPKGQYIQRSGSGSGATEFTGCGNCSVGTYQPRDMDIVFNCLPCSAGSATNQTGQSECQLCPAGRSSGAPGATSCIRCSAGKYSPSNGGSQCFDCAVGTSTLGKDTAHTCEQCPKGRFGNQTALDSCYSCPAGRSTKQAGHAYGDECGCESGSFLNSMDLCQQCPLGLECPGFELPLLAAPGYMLMASDESPFTLHSHPPGVYRCQPAHACPGGGPGTCAQGRMGLACGTCPEDHWMDSAGCHKCSGKLASGMLLAVWFALVVTLPIVVCLLNRKNDEVEPQASGWSIELISLKGTAVSMLRVLQFMGLVSLLTVPWPQSIGTVVGNFDLFLLNQDKLPELSCLSSSSWQRYAFVASTMPLAVSLCVICFYTSRRLHKGFQHPWATASMSNTLGSMLHMSFTPLVTIALTPMMCYSHPAGSKSLLKFPSVLCGDSQHHNMLVLAIPLLMLVLCFLASALKTTWQAPARVASADDASARAFLSSSRYLFLLYRLDRWYWGSALLPRSFMLSLIPVIIPNDSGRQVLVFTAITLMYTVLQVAYQPWRTPLLNSLDQIVGVSQLCFLTVVGVAFVPSAAAHVGDTSNHGSTDSLYSALLALFSVLPLCLGMLAGGTVFSAMYHIWLQKVNPLDQFLLRWFSRQPEALELGRALSITASTVSKVQPDTLIEGVVALETYDARTLANAVVVLETFFGTQAKDVDVEPTLTPSGSGARGFPPRILRRTTPQGTAESKQSFATVVPLDAYESETSVTRIPSDPAEPCAAGALPHTIGQCIP
mmetsp:Transcript_16445/g.41847  ORF Transcript_16445/g.41847 Transcript_16445/m.41847 type:complete len:1033 (-) Transcript_16445:117-3215(-)